MKDGEDDKELSSYSQLSRAITFFLNESFRHLENEIVNQTESKLFSEKIKDIDTTEDDNKIVSSFSGSIKSTLDLIQFEGNPISDQTLEKLTLAWNEAQEEALTAKLKFQASTKISSQDSLAHVMSFAFAIEILLNRHIFLMNLHGSIDNFVFNTLDKASVINKIIYLFKPEINDKKFNPERISRLFQLRNFAVHFTRDNSQKFQTSFDELIEIWKESLKIMEIMIVKENLRDNDFHPFLSNLKNNFIEKNIFKRK